MKNPVRLAQDREQWRITTAYRLKKMVFDDDDKTQYGWHIWIANHQLRFRKRADKGIDSAFIQLFQSSVYPSHVPPQRMFLL